MDDPLLFPPPPDDPIRLPVRSHCGLLADFEPLKEHLSSQSFRSRQQVPIK
jgi:hypothetical protein